MSGHCGEEVSAMTDSELLTAIFGGDSHSLREACVLWVASSRPFRAFLEENAGKIRKKARQAGDAESLRDLQLEMRAAYHVLADRRVSLTYERYLAEKQRGPDFTVTFKGHIVFNIEARRLRAPVTDSRLGEAICGKLGQMPPSAVNVLLVGMDIGAPTSPDGATIMKSLVHRAEAKRDAYFAERGFRDARDFLRALQRLSALLLLPGWDAALPPDPALWLNPQARFPLPADAQKLLRR